MTEQLQHEQLDAALEALLTRGEVNGHRTSDNESLLTVAADLRETPSPAFKEQLRSRLAAQSLAMPAPPVSIADDIFAPNDERTSVLPSLFDSRISGYQPDRANFTASFLLHTAALAIIATSSMWFVGRKATPVLQERVTAVVMPYDIGLPPSADESSGGGGGGNRDKLPASQGAPPDFAWQQITPPTVIIANEPSRLSVNPTLVGPPDLKVAQGTRIGDPLSDVLAPLSNGPGVNSGIGSGNRGGVGPGTGPGIGQGIGGGCCTGVYRVGGGVTAPKAIHTPDPEFSDEARRVKHQGTVMVWAVIGPDGIPNDVRIQRPLGMGLDEKAIEAVRQWRFRPATKDGRPVSVEINIEVSFRLY